MNKNKAIRVLTAELSKHSGISIVREDWHKKELIKTSKHFHQFKNPIIVNYKHYADVSFGDKPEKLVSGWFFSYTNQNLKTSPVYMTIGGLMKKIESCNGANYFFVDNQFQNKSSELLNTSHFFVTPYSIIGEDEIIDIKNLFYKDVQPQIQSAMDILSLENYADIYPLYVNNKSSNIAYTAVKEFLNRIPKLNYYSDLGNDNIKVTDVKIIGDLDLLNSELEKIGIKSRLDPTKYREERVSHSSQRWINKMNIEEVVNEIEQKSFIIAQEDTRKYLLKDFWDFVFTIPYKDQNIESNLNILNNHAGEIDYISILGEEYNKSRHFPEYFNCLDDLQQEKVARCLKALPERNIANDSFLWSRGFKEINRDYMQIYKENSDKFIEYFKSRKPDDKKTILKGIMNCDYTNKTVANWLDENEIDLVREVSMDG